MNFQHFMNDLNSIQRDPNHNYVRVTQQSNRNIEFVFSFPLSDRGYPISYYFPGGMQDNSRITKIYIDRAGGAGAVYVYTSPNQYPHLTITDGGNNVHWTVAQGNINDHARPQCIEEFLARYS